MNPNPKKARLLSTPLRIVAGAVLMAALSTSVPAMGAQRGLTVHAEVRGRKSAVQIAASTVKPYGVAWLNGRRLTIECLNATRWTKISITYSILCPVCVDYVAEVQMKVKLPNGRHRWIAIAAWDGITLAMNITTTPGPGPCGAKRPDTFSIPSPYGGYLVVA